MGHVGNPHHRGTPDELKQKVITEISSRARRGHPLNSGANRGDWLYAAALRFYGSWGAAVEAAGVEYETVKQAALSREELLRRIQALAANGQPLFARDHGLLNTNALRHFGGWKAAVEAAGCKRPSMKKWTAEKVVKEIVRDLRRGLPVTSLAVIRRNQPLYGAGRREFGSWAAALAAVDPALVKLRPKREKKSRT